MPNYKLTGESWIYRIDDDARIACSDENSDYRDYLTWLSEGNIPLPADPAPRVIPDSVSMRQARLSLLATGMLSSVNEALAVMGGADGEAARIEWEYATEVVRDSALVQGMAGALGLTDEQLDGLFVAGALL